MTTRLLPILFLCLLAACARPDLRSADDVKRLASAYREILHLKAQLSRPDSALSPDAFRRQVADVFQRYGYTQETFQQELTRLGQSPDRLNAFTDDVFTQLNSKK